MRGEIPINSGNVVSLRKFILTLLYEGRSNYINENNMVQFSFTLQLGPTR